MKAYYPVSLDVHQRPCAVIGGGDEAVAKTKDLLISGARVRVVTPNPICELSTLAASDRIILCRRPYEHGDLAGVFLAVVFGGEVADLDVLLRHAVEDHVLLNVVDDPEPSDFIAPAILREGALTLAISTGGLSPALAVRLREQLREFIDGAYGKLLEIMGELRPAIRSAVPDFEERRRLAYQMVDSGALALLRRGREEEARLILDRALKERSTGCVHAD